MKMQLFLVYRGRFSWLDVDTMPIYELLWYYNTLIEWKKEEAEAMGNPSDGENRSSSTPFEETVGNDAFE